MKNILVFTFLFFPLFLIAQKKEGRELADSLEKALPSLHEDTTKVITLCRLSNTFCYINQDSGISFGERGLALAEKLEYEGGIARANMALGNNYLTRFNNALALKYFLSALSVNEKINNKTGIASSLGNIANVYSNESNYPNALEYNFKALKIFEELGNKQGLALNLSNIGSLYRNQSNYSKALEYNFKALKISQELGLKSSIASVYSNIGNIYMDKGIFDTALIYDLQSLKITVDMGDRIRLASRCVSTGNVYLHLRQFDSALIFNFRGLSIAEKTGDNMDIAAALGSIGDCYLYFAKEGSTAEKRGSKKDNLNKAVDYLERALAIDKEIGDLDEIQLANASLSEAQFLLGDYKSSLESYKAFITAKDSVFSVVNNLKIADLETTRNLDLKEKDIQIEQLKAKNKRNERFIYLGGIIILLIVIGIIVRKMLLQRSSNMQLAREKRKHLKHIQAQEDVLKDIAYMQSHNIRGSVATLLGLSKLFNLAEPHDPYNAELMEDVISVAERLDGIIKDVVSKENEVRAGSPGEDLPQ